MRQQQKGPHRLRHEERPASAPTTLDRMNVGDVFVREGSPHMRVSPPSDLRVLEGDGGVWVVNLQTGGCWACKPDCPVYPATDVVLTFKSSRRD